MKCIFGLDPIDSGKIIYRDKEIYPITPENCIKNGMAFITENRREEGLLIPKTLKENVVLASLKKQMKNRLFMDKKKEEAGTERMVKELNIRTFDPNKQIVGTLSGGNQQKVVFGKWVLSQPKVFILDEPTRGVDVFTGELMRDEFKPEKIMKFAVGGEKK